MNVVNNRYCENTLIINNKEYKLEKIWRTSKNDKTLDAKGSPFPYPKQGPPSNIPEIDDIIHILHVINTYLNTKKDMKLMIYHAIVYYVIKNRFQQKDICMIP